MNIEKPQTGGPYPSIEVGHTGLMLLWSVKEENGSGLCEQPLAKQVDEQNDCVAVSTVASQAQRARVQVMLGAATLAEEPLAAAWTFVHCVGHEQPLALELLYGGQPDP